MESVDFDRQFRLMELADSEAEVDRLSAGIRVYIEADPAQEPTRRAEWKTAVGRWHDRSMIELATFRELMGQPVAV